MRASKKVPSSLIGVNRGKALAKLHREAALTLVNGSPDEATHARLSRSEAALRADFEIKVVDPRDMCFL